MAAATCTVTYLTEEYDITYDYTTEPYPNGKIKNIFTVESGGDTVFTLTRYGNITNFRLVIKEVLDGYLALLADIAETELVKTDVGAWDGDLDTYLSDFPE
jgi:hypothetical protein